MIDIQIDRDQLQSIIKKADPTVVKVGIRQMMEEVGKTGQSVAREEIMGGTEQAQYSILYRTRPLSAKVYTVMPQARAMSIEEGRPAGEEVPYMQAARYVLNRRYLTQRRLASLTEEERSRIDSFINAVKISGAKGKEYMSSARDTIKQDLPKMLKNLARKIERVFGS